MLAAGIDRGIDAELGDHRRVHQQVRAGDDADLAPCLQKVVAIDLDLVGIAQHVGLPHQVQRNHVALDMQHPHQVQALEGGVVQHRLRQADIARRRPRQHRGMVRAGRDHPRQADLMDGRIVDQQIVARADPAAMAIADHDAVVVQQHVGLQDRVQVDDLPIDDDEIVAHPQFQQRDVVQRAVLAHQQQGLVRLKRDRGDVVIRHQIELLDPVHADEAALQRRRHPVLRRIVVALRHQHRVREAGVAGEVQPQRRTCGLALRGGREAAQHVRIAPDIGLADEVVAIDAPRHGDHRRRHRGGMDRDLVDQRVVAQDQVMALPGHAGAGNVGGAGRARPVAACDRGAFLRLARLLGRHLLAIGGHERVDVGAGIDLDAVLVLALDIGALARMDLGAGKLGFGQVGLAEGLGDQAEGGLVGGHRHRQGKAQLLGLRRQRLQPRRQQVLIDQPLAHGIGIHPVAIGQPRLLDHDDGDGTGHGQNPFRHRRHHPARRLGSPGHRGIGPVGGHPLGRDRGPREMVVQRQDGRRRIGRKPLAGAIGGHIADIGLVIERLIGMAGPLLDRIDRTKVGSDLLGRQPIIFDPHPSMFFREVKNSDEVPDRFFCRVDHQHVCHLPR